MSALELVQGVECLVLSGKKWLNCKVGENCFDTRETLQKTQHVFFSSSWSACKFAFLRHSYLLPIPDKFVLRIRIPVELGSRRFQLPCDWSGILLQYQNWK
jgi:hypothetical protein